MQSVTKLIHQPTVPLKKKSDRTLWFSWVKDTMPLFIAKPQSWESAQKLWDYTAFNDHAFWVFPDFFKILSFPMCAWQWVLSALEMLPWINDFSSSCSREARSLPLLPDSIMMRTPQLHTPQQRCLQQGPRLEPVCENGLRCIKQLLWLQL